jgi:hypothetical protein
VTLIKAERRDYLWPPVLKEGSRMTDYVARTTDEIVTGEVPNPAGAKFVTEQGEILKDSSESLFLKEDTFWQGTFYLTNRRIAFLNKDGQLDSVSLEDVTGVNYDRDYVVGLATANLPGVETGWVNYIKISRRGGDPYLVGLLPNHESHLHAVGNALMALGGMKSTLGINAKLDSVKRVRQFMFEDLDKTIGLASTVRGAPNFMLALALCAYTEYWGRFVKGIESGKSDACFAAFFERLGDCYRDLINDPKLVTIKDNGDADHEVYRRVRSGLAQSYLIEASTEINLGRGECGVEREPNTGKYTFNILTYFDDFKKAVDEYVAELESGTADWESFEKVMDKKPELI